MITCRDCGPALTKKVISRLTPRQKTLLPVKPLSIQPWLGRVCGMLFFGGIFVYALLGIDSTLRYDWQIRGFSTLPGFLAGFLIYPGGPVEYCARLLCQGYANGYLGALLITAQCAGLAALTHLYIRLLVGRAISFVGYIPALLAICLMSAYDHHLSVVLSVIVGLLLACLFLLAMRRIHNGWLLLAVFVMMLCVGYYLADVAIVVFAPAAALPQLWRHRRWPVVSGVGYLVLAAALPLASQLWLFPSLEFGCKSWFLPEPPEVRVMTWRLLGFLPVLSLAALIYRQLRPDKSATQPGRHLILNNFIPITGAIVVMSCLGVACYLSHMDNAGAKRNLMQDHYACNEQWAELIEFSRTVPTEAYSSQLCWDVDLALCMTGRLGDEMFAFPQERHVNPDDSMVRTPANEYKLAQTCLRVGRANDAEIIAQESITTFMQYPRAMASLAKIYLVKDNAPAARRYLNALSHDLVFGAWATNWLAQLDGDSTLAGNAEIQRLRRQSLPRRDMFPGQGASQTYVAFDSLGTVEGSLQKDPANQMAFEYGMAEIMLSKNLADLIKLAPRIKNMTGPAYVTPDGRRRTPVHFQEALAIYCDKAGPVKIDGFEIEPATLSHMAEFKSIMSTHPDRQQAMALTWKFRKTYFFYNCFGPGDYR